MEKLIGRNAFDLHCLGVSSKRYPRHPLFVRGDVTPILYKKRIFREVIQAIRTKEKSEITSREGIDPVTESDYEFHKDVMEE